MITLSFTQFSWGSDFVKVLNFSKFAAANLKFHTQAIFSNFFRLMSDPKLLRKRFRIGTGSNQDRAEMKSPCLASHF